PQGGQPGAWAAPGGDPIGAGQTGAGAAGRKPGAWTAGDAGVGGQDAAPGQAGAASAQTSPSPSGQGRPGGTPGASGSASLEASPAVRRIATETGIDPAGVAGSGKAGRVTKGDMLAAASATDATRTPVTTPPTPA